jgi:CheY-like chemotaxis protein
LDRPRTLPRILIVEDNEADLQLLRLAMHQHDVNAQLDVIPDGELAVQYVAGHQNARRSDVPDLVLLDVHLPKRSGFEVLEEMRRVRAFRDVPVIILTSSDIRLDAEQAKRFGVNAFLRKPCDLGEFLRIADRIKRLLRNG